MTITGRGELTQGSKDGVSLGFFVTQARPDRARGGVR